MKVSARVTFAIILTVAFARGASASSQLSSPVVWATNPDIVTCVVFNAGKTTQLLTLTLLDFSGSGLPSQSRTCDLAPGAQCFLNYVPVDTPPLPEIMISVCQIATSGAGKNLRAAIEVLTEHVPVLPTDGEAKVVVPVN